jgi:hypothetical protein
VSDTFVPTATIKSLSTLKAEGDSLWGDYTWRIQPYLGTIPYSDSVVLTGNPIIWYALFSQTVTTQIRASAQKSSACIKDYIQEDQMAINIPALSIGRLPQTLVGAYRGTNTSGGNPFDVTLRLDSFLNGTSYHHLVRIKGLPATCPELLTKGDWGQWHFSILEGNNTATGCEGVQGFGWLSDRKDTLHIQYEYFTSPSMTTRTAFHFIGTRI